MSKLKWYARQAVPTKYATAYRGGDARTPMFTTWWMWLGRCYRVATRSI